MLSMIKYYDKLQKSITTNNKESRKTFLKFNFHKLILAKMQKNRFDDKKDTVKTF